MKGPLVLRGWSGTTSARPWWPSPYNFLVLGALLGEKSGRPKIFFPKVRHFFTFYVLADQIPTGGKSRSTGFLGHSGPGRALARREIRGGKQKNTNSRIETEKRETNPLQLGPNTQS